MSKQPSPAVVGASSPATELDSQTPDGADDGEAADGVEVLREALITDIIRMDEEAWRKLHAQRAAASAGGEGAAVGATAAGGEATSNASRTPILPILEDSQEDGRPTKCRRTSEAPHGTAGA